MRTTSRAAIYLFVLSALPVSALASGGVPMAAESVLDGLRAQGLAGAGLALPSAPATPAAAPAAKPAVAKSTLTPELLKWLTIVINGKGEDTDFPDIVLTDSGIANAGSKPMRFYAVIVKDVTHSFMISREKDPDIIVQRIETEKTRIIRAHRDGTAVLEVIFDNRTHKSDLADAAAAQRDANAEYAYWDDYSTAK